MSCATALCQSCSGDGPFATEGQKCRRASLDLFVSDELRLGGSSDLFFSDAFSGRFGKTARLKPWMHGHQLMAALVDVLYLQSLLNWVSMCFF